MRFNPGAAPSVLGVPASEVVDLSVGADELWGRSAVALGEAVAAAASPWEAAAKLEAAVGARLADAAEPDPIAMEAVRLLLPGRTRDVTSLPSELYISESQLRRRLHEATGFAPKLLHRCCASRASSPSRRDTSTPAGSWRASPPTPATPTSPT